MEKPAHIAASTGAAIVRAALEARGAAEAAQVNDMIQMLVGERHERFVGDTVSNLGPLSTPGSYDHKALEPVTNMHDAVLERFARERFGRDLAAVPYRTPREAAGALLGHLNRDQQAEMARIEVFESDAPARQTKRVTLVYRDKGCGIANEYVGESIFRIGSRHKQVNLWQQGAFGMGATTCYPNAQAVVLVTRRPKDLLDADEPDVITVAVAEWQLHQKGRGIYYLVSESPDDNPKAAPLAIAATEVPEFEPGTYLALVSYATDGFHTGRNDRTSLEFMVNTRLWRPPMPVMLVNHVAKGDHPKTHQGRGPQFDAVPRADREVFHDVLPFRMNGQTRHLPISVFYFEGGPAGDVGAMRNFIAQGHSVLLLANGQVHKHWDSRELRYRADRLTKLYDRVLVVAELDEIPVDERTGQLFTPDRVDLVQSPDAKRLQDSLAAMLNSWPELRDLNNELVRKAIQNRTAGRSTVDVARRIRAHLAFKGGVSSSGERKEGHDVPPKRKWAEADLWPDPTTLEGPLKVRALPGKTKFVHYQLNAIDRFFASGRGQLILTCDYPRIGPAELVAGGQLKGGMVRASLLVPEDVPVGTIATITASVSGWAKAAGGIGSDLEWTSELEVVGAIRDEATASRKKNTAGVPSTGPQVAVVWRTSDDGDGSFTGGIPGEIELIEACVLAAEHAEYADLAQLGSERVTTVVLNKDFTPLKQYEAERIKRHDANTLDEARDRYAVGVGVGLLVLEEHERKLEKAGKPRREETLAERQAVARAALALMPDFDRLVKEAGL